MHRLEMAENCRSVEGYIGSRSGQKRPNNRHAICWFSQDLVLEYEEGSMLIGHEHVAILRFRRSNGSYFRGI